MGTHGSDEVSRDFGDRGVARQHRLPRVVRDHERVELGQVTSGRPVRVLGTDATYAVEPLAQVLASDDSVNLWVLHIPDTVVVEVGVPASSVRGSPDALVDLEQTPRPAVDIGGVRVRMKAGFLRHDRGDPRFGQVGTH